MMGKSLNYAYPRKFAEGGDVQGYRRAGIEFVEHNGQMVPKEALRALQGAVGLEGGARDSAENLQYDVDGDGRLTSGDALAFMKYGLQEDYTGNSDFFKSFYGGDVTPMGSTFTTPPTATPTPQVVPSVPPAATMPGLNLSMGDVSSAFTSAPPSPVAGQEAYQSYVTQNNPSLQSLYTPPEQQGLGSLLQNPLVAQSNQTTTNPYLQTSAPTQSIFQRPPGG